MTRRHMEAAAEQVAAMVSCGSVHSAQIVADAYVELFTRFNPLFNRARFLKACKLVS